MRRGWLWEVSIVKVGEPECWGVGGMKNNPILHCRLSIPAAEPDATDLRAGGVSTRNKWKNRFLSVTVCRETIPKGG